MSEFTPNTDYDADEVINNFKEKINWPKKDEITVVETPKGAGLKFVLSAIVTAVIAAIMWYVMYPSFNFKDTKTYEFVIGVIAIFIGSMFVLFNANARVERREYVKKKSIVPMVLIGVIVVAMLVGWAVGCTFFRAKTYSNLMTVTESEFNEDFKDIEYDTVPRLDESTAYRLADQQLGQLSQYKSQYVVTSYTTQINYKNRPVRVAYLEYADFFKWLNNTKEGLPAYMIIDVVTQKVSVVNCVEKFGEGIKYSPTELFNEKLLRHLRFQYPTAIMDTPNFEIADDQHPYWITPVLDKTIGLFGGTDVKGAIVTDALNGESKYYSMDEIKKDKSLNWIDVVYTSRLLVEQYNYHGKFLNGFWNSIFAQNDVNITSDGNGYIAMDDDVWVYTGVTSSESDASNFGFILCNQRTKETRYYSKGGAQEKSAQESAEDAVQNYNYRSTFPILLDIEGEPTYFMSLYGDSYTVKGYALVNLDDKTLVGYGLIDNDNSSDANALNSAVKNYIDALKNKGKVDEDASAEKYYTDDKANSSSTSNNNEKDNKTTTTGNTVTGKVADIKTSVSGGETVYYLKVADKYYYINVSDCMDVLLVSQGDSVTITFTGDTSGDFVKATNVKR